MDDLTFLSAATLARLIRDGQTSSEEVVRAHLERIGQINPTINAVVVVMADSALADARRLDDEQRRGNIAGPLHGVPVTIKDAIETAGVVTTGGTLGRAGYVPDSDATVVRRLRNVGAVVVGKTNLPELSLSGEADNLVYGRTLNPYHHERVTGGSSGGEGAAIAAGMSPLGMGSDVGGSVRLPAHFCGIAGIKATSGLVPSTGHYPSADGIFARLWQIGPMARFVEDLVLSLPVIAGPDGIDPNAFPVPLRDSASVDPSSLRVAYHTEIAEAPVTPETAKAVRDAAQALADAGVTVEETHPNCLDHMWDRTTAFYSADGGDQIRRSLERAGTTEAHPLTLEVIESQGHNAESVEDLAETLVWVDQFRRDMLAFLGDYDAILCPNHSHPAMEHGLSNGNEYYPGYLYSMAYNLTGWPGAVVRAGASPEGLPICVQLVAGPWREDISLALAALVENALGGWQPPTQ